MESNVPMRDKNELTIIANTISSERRLALAADTDEIYNTIVNSTRAKISEKIFIDYFLEPFSSAKALASDSPDLARWVDLAGGFFNEVDIVDEQNNVVCTCPPIMKPLKIDEQVDNINFTNMAREYIHKTNHIKASGVNYLYGAINQIAHSMSPDTLDSINKWTSIINFYQDKINGKKPTIGVVKQLSSKQTEEELLDYIEF